MNDTLMISEKDELVMKLLHYFVTKENYSPIMVNGVKNEIWLENLDAYYKIIRINSNYIHNVEQFEFDIYKINNICKQIGKKTLTRKLKTLNILTDTNDDINIDNTKEIDNYIIKTQEDLSSKDGIVSLFPQIVNERVDNSHGLEFLLNVSNDINKKTETENKFYEKVFTPKKIIATKVIMVLNILIYIASIILSITNNIDVYTLFGLHKSYVLKGEIYRLVTAGFLHSGIAHLICNMYSLNIIGSQIESFIGKTKFLIVYFVSMITGSLLSCVINNSWSVGASGAIFGLLGSLLYFGYHYRIYLGSVLKTQIIPLILINLGIGLIIPNIDIFAHIGGLVGGLLSTMVVGIERKSTKQDRVNGLICLILLIAFLFYLLFRPII